MAETKWAPGALQDEESLIASAAKMINELRDENARLKQELEDCKRALRKAQLKDISFEATPYKGY